MRASVIFGGLVAASLVLSLSACDKKPEASKAKPAAYDLSAASNQRFLADYATRPGVFKLPYGLEYRIIKSGAGKPFNSKIVSRLRREYGLKSRFERLRNQGMLTLSEIAQLLGISACHVKIWKHHGILKAHTYNDKNECLYEHPGDNPPRKMQGRKGAFTLRHRATTLVSHRVPEVQCET